MSEEKEEYTEQSILKALNSQYLSQPKYLINNLYVFGWESDYLALTKSGYWYECEVKISVSDFKADFKKKDKHNTLSNLSPNIRRPNYFAYVTPEGLLDISDIPEYAGLIEVSKHGYLSFKKQPPKLHAEKLELKLQDKFYYNWKSEAIRANRLQREIDSLRYKVENQNIFI